MQKGMILMLALITLMGCQPQKKKNETAQKAIITVSILPQKYFVEQIAGEYFQVNVMVPPGASPDDYEPTARQITNLADSKIYFHIGHLGFELAWLPKISKSSPGIHLVSASKGIELLAGECNHDHHDEGHGHGIDPHVWTSPANVKTMCRNLFEEMAQLYPEMKPEWEINLKEFIAKVDTLEAQINKNIQETSKRDFMIYHPAFAYFAADYGLTQHAIENEGKSPSTAHMKRMVDLAREKGIRTIFIQSQFEIEKAEAIAKEIGGTVAPVDNLAYDWLESTYDFIQKLMDALSE